MYSTRAFSSAHPLFLLRFLLLHMGWTSRQRLVCGEKNRVMLVQKHRLTQRLYVPREREECNVADQKAENVYCEKLP